jgi:hypothetical protein
MPFLKGNKLGIGNKYNLGKIPWNKNLSKDSDERVRLIGRSISIKNKGKHYSFNTEFKKGGKSLKGMLGKKHSLETRFKISHALSGEKSPFWKNGKFQRDTLVRLSIESRIWREAVFSRDNWGCQSCGKRGGNLNAHHIKPFSTYPDLRFAIDNGKTLCVLCHKLEHQKKEHV